MGSTLTSTVFILYIQTDGKVQGKTEIKKALAGFDSVPVGAYVFLEVRGALSVTTSSITLCVSTLWKKPHTKASFQGPRQVFLITNWRENTFCVQMSVLACLLVSVHTDGCV